MTDQQLDQVRAGLPPKRPTPQVTVEAVMYVVRLQGLAALRGDPGTYARLTRCDAAARAQINQRIAKLFPKKTAA